VAIGQRDDERVEVFGAIYFGAAAEAKECPRQNEEKRPHAIRW
jgi:hypothetical protein